MILLPLAGFLSGLVIGRRVAYVVTAALAAIGFSLVALLTDEIAAWWDLFVWGDTVVALLLTWVGIRVRHRIAARRTTAA